MSLVACAKGRWVYEKANATPAKIERDMTLCRKETTSYHVFAITQEQRIDRDAYNRCMQRLGYTVRRES